MRRILAAMLSVGLLALAIPAAATQSANYKDEFTSIGWGGSDGSHPWSGPWREIGDDNDEKFGAVRVVSSGNCPSGNCISISALFTNIGVRRSANISILEGPELCFDLVNIPSAVDIGATQLLVQVNDGGGWTTLDGGVYDLGEEFQVHPTFDISEFKAANFQVRFLVVGLAMTTEVFIDNVEISGTLIEGTTTTTAPSTTSTTEGDGGTTTTTKPGSSTTTTTARATTTTRSTSDTSNPDGESSTTTTPAGTTTTSGDDSTASTLVAAGRGNDDLPPGSDGVAEGSGIRQSTRGLQANFDGNLFGEVSAISPITGVDFQARFSMAVEIFEASWVWIVLLALVIAWSIVTGMERRRSQLLG